MTGTNVRAKGIKRYFEPKSGKWYCYHRATGERITETFGSACFFKHLENLEKGRTSKLLLEHPKGKKYEKFYKIQTLDYCCDLLKMAKRRAKSKGIEFNLSIDDIVELLEKQDYKCAVTGNYFDYAKTKIGTRIKFLYRPSLDRIDSKQGYVTGNVRVVMSAVNIALSDFGDSIFNEIAKGAVHVKSRQKR